MAEGRYECPTCGEADPYRCECSKVNCDCPDPCQDVPCTPRTRQAKVAGMWWDKYVPHPENVRVVVGADRQVRVRLLEPETRTCRECGDEFETTMIDTGTKWARTCPSCLRLHM